MVQIIYCSFFCPNTFSNKNLYGKTKYQSVVSSDVSRGFVLRMDDEQEEELNLSWAQHLHCVLDTYTLPSNAINTADWLNTYDIIS